MQLRQLSVILKVTRSCNLDCRYCYEGIHPEEYMTEELAAHCIHDILDTTDHGVITFHGGEPLLAGKGFFRSIFAAEEEMLVPGKTIEHHLQTNGTLIDRDWIDLFRKYHIQTGISLDGPLPVHDRNRVFPRGRGSFDRVFRNLKKMADQGIDLNCLAVVTEASCENIPGVFGFFSEGPFRTIDFLPCVTVREVPGRKDPGKTIPPREYSRFMNAFFDLWIDSGQTFSVRTFEDYLNMVQGREPATCGFRYPKPCSYQVITVDVNGDVYPCDKFTGIPEMRIGNIGEECLGRLLSGRANKRIFDAANEIPAICERCRIAPFCSGGCLHHRYIASGNPGGKSYYCTAYKDIFHHISTRLAASGGTTCT